MAAAAHLPVIRWQSLQEGPQGPPWGKDWHWVERKWSFWSWPLPGMRPTTTSLHGDREGGSQAGPRPRWGQWQISKSAQPSILALELWASLCWEPPTLELLSLVLLAPLVPEGPTLPKLYPRTQAHAPTMPSSFIATHTPPALPEWPCAWEHRLREAIQGWVRATRLDLGLGGVGKGIWGRKVLRPKPTPTPGFPEWCPPPGSWGLACALGGGGSSQMHLPLGSPGSWREEKPH